jgi:hypothetical protein
VHAIATRGKKISRGRRQESAGKAHFRSGKACRWTATTKSNDPATPIGLLAGLAPEVWSKDTTCGGEVNVGRRRLAASEAAASKKRLVLLSRPRWPRGPGWPNVFVGHLDEMVPETAMAKLRSQRIQGGGWPAAADVGLEAEHWTAIPRKTWPTKLEQRVMAATEPTLPYYRQQTLGAQLAKLASLTGGSAEGLTLRRFCRRAAEDRVLREERDERRSSRRSVDKR